MTPAFVMSLCEHSTGRSDLCEIPPGLAQRISASDSAAAVAAVIMIVVVVVTSSMAGWRMVMFIVPNIYPQMYQY